MAHPFTNAKTRSAGWLLRVLVLVQLGDTHEYHVAQDERNDLHPR